jgi:tetratricopeptide (TPR) repeat protein
MLNKTDAISNLPLIRVLPIIVLLTSFISGCTAISQSASHLLLKHAQMYALASDFNAAIVDLNTAITLDSENPDLYTLRGQMYLAIYEWDNAGADFDHAIELSPNYAPAYFHRGVLYYSILQTGLTTRDDALADFQHYLELAPEGEFAAQAAEYVENIERELEALNG